MAETKNHFNCLISNDSPVSLKHSVLNTDVHFTHGIDAPGLLQDSQNLFFQATSVTGKVS